MYTQGSTGGCLMLCSVCDILTVTHRYTKHWHWTYQNKTTPTEAKDPKKCYRRRRILFGRYCAKSVRFRNMWISLFCVKNLRFFGFAREDWQEFGFSWDQEAHLLYERYSNTHFKLGCIFILLFFTSCLRKDVVKIYLHTPILIIIMKPW